MIMTVTLQSTILQHLFWFGNSHCLLVIPNGLETVFVDSYLEGLTSNKVWKAIVILILSWIIGCNVTAITGFPEDRDVWEQL